jgi:hypothetical protein
VTPLVQLTKETFTINNVKAAAIVQVSGVEGG